MSLFLANHGKHFFLANNIRLIPLKSAFLPFRKFSTSPLTKFRVSNFKYTKNITTLKRSLVFGSLFITATTFATPYAFAYTPLSYFNTHPAQLVYGLIGLNVGIFGLWQVPRYWRFLQRYALLEKDHLYSTWAIVGSTFSHQELWHLGMNMLALYSFGTSLAQILGASTFTQLYLNSGIVASVASIAYPILRQIPVAAASLGASGSLFGVFGAFAYLIPQAKIMLLVFPIPGGAWVAFLGACAWNVAGAVLKWGKLDYAAHLGGSVAGVVYGWWVSRRVQRRKRVRGY